MPEHTDEETSRLPVEMLRTVSIQGSDEKGREVVTDSRCSVPFEDSDTYDLPDEAPPGWAEVDR